MPNYLLITPPTTPPVSLAEIKEHLRVEVGDEDAAIASMLRAAVRRVEAEIMRPLVLQQWRLSYDCFPAAFTLKRPPVISVDSITYTDLDQVVQTLATTEYSVDLDGEPARVWEAVDKSWPSTALVPNAVQLTLTCGYLIPFTADADNDQLTTPNYQPSDGDVLRLSNSGGALPSGLVAEKDYYVVSASGNTFSLAATSGGAAIDLTDAGTGSNFVGELPASIAEAIKLLAHHMYWQRDAAASGAIPLFREILDDVRWVR